MHIIIEHPIYKQGQRSISSFILLVDIVLKARSGEADSTDEVLRLLVDIKEQNLLGFWSRSDFLQKK
jgi:hypothetical protein